MHLSLSLHLFFHVILDVLSDKLSNDINVLIASPKKNFWTFLSEDILAFGLLRFGHLWLGLLVYAHIYFGRNISDIIENGPFNIGHFIRGAINCVDFDRLC